MTDAELGRQIASYLDATTGPVATAQTSGRELIMTLNDPKSGGNRRLTRGAAAAALVVVAVGAIALSTRDSDEDQSATGRPTPTIAHESSESIPPPSDDPEITPREQAAIDLAERYFTALYAGDVDTAVEMVPQVSLRVVAEAAWVDWWSTTADDPNVTDDVWPTGPCWAGAESTQGLLVTCPVRSHDPLAVAMGLDDLTWNVHITGANEVAAFIAPAADFRTYLDQAGVYAAYLDVTGTLTNGVCDSDTYGPDEVYDPGIAMSQACADLVVDVADDAAAWFEAGQPDTWPPDDG